MCLLHCIARVKDRFIPPLNVSVVHFSHNSRSSTEMTHEMNLVKYWSDHYDLPFYHRELPQISDRNTENTEAVAGFQNYARDWRRRECLQLIRELHTIGTDKTKNNTEYCIATGHHLDDQIESMLFKILRGTHLSRLTPVCTSTVYEICFVLYSLTYIDAWYRWFLGRICKHYTNLLVCRYPYYTHSYS